MWHAYYLRILMAALLLILNNRLNSLNHQSLFIISQTSNNNKALLLFPTEITTVLNTILIGYFLTFCELARRGVNSRLVPHNKLKRYFPRVTVSTTINLLESRNRHFQNNERKNLDGKTQKSLSMPWSFEITFEL